MPITKPVINVEDYLNNILNEHLNLDLSEDPEVTATDPLEREAAADRWYDSRMNILNLNEKDAIRQLRNAVDHKFLDGSELYGAEQRVGELYGLLREQAEDRYEDVVGVRPQSREPASVH